MDQAQRDMLLAAVRRDAAEIEAKLADLRRQIEPLEKELGELRRIAAYASRRPPGGEDAPPAQQQAPPPAPPADKGRLAMSPFTLEPTTDDICLKAERFLREARRPVRASDITKTIFPDYEPKSDDRKLENRVFSTLRRRPLFYKVGRGRFTLAEFVNTQEADTATEPANTASGGFLPDSRL